jgi:beta-glucosidase
MRILVLAVILCIALAGIYQPYYDEAYSIAVAMTFDQKIGQCLQVDFGAFSNKNKTNDQEAVKLHLGSLLVGGDGMPNDNGDLIDIPDKEDQVHEAYAGATLNKWQKLASRFNYSITVTTSDNKYDIRPLLGTDAVHGNQHVAGTILFPHNVGLACSHNPNNFLKAGKWTAQGVKQSGFNYAFSPTVAVSHNPQWGRFYETMGQNADDIYQYSKSYTEGLQGKPGSLTGVLGSAKHFYADGATLYGADEGNAIVGSFKSFLRHNLQGYNGSIASNVGSVMVSYSSINWIPNAIGPAIQTHLRQTLKFDGFVISDYDEMQRIITQKLPTNFNIMNASWDSVTTMLNAGVDMFMIPGWRGVGAVNDVINGFKIAFKNKTITEDRINDAVARIIAVKLALGAAKKVSQPAPGEHLKKEEAIEEVTTGPNGEEYNDALTAVHESLVLLKNDNNVIPFSSNIKYIVLIGERIVNINKMAKYYLFKNYDDIGLQNGGWTLRWQGFLGNDFWKGDNLKNSNASSIITGLSNAKPDVPIQ